MDTAKPPIKPGSSPAEDLDPGDQMLRRVLEHFPGVAFWKDRQLIYRGCNRAFAATAGLAHPSEIVGKSDRDLPWAKTEAERYRSEDRAVIEGGSSLDLVESERQADGQIAWFQTSKVPLLDAGQVIGVLGTSIDITERRRADEALRQSARQQAALLNNIPDVAWLKDRANRYIAVNEPYAVACGLPATEIIGKTDLDIWPEELARGYLANDEEVLRTGQSKRIEEVLATPAGTIPIETVKTPIFDEAGQVVGTTGVARDVTERHRAEAERMQLERQLLHAQKLESLGVLAGGIAHDFNNLLMALIGNLSLALADLAREAPAYGPIEQAQMAAERAAALTGQMLAYSGKGRFVMKPLDLGALIEENVHLFRSSISRTITMNLETAAGLPRIEADAGQVQQVVMNLISNASEAIGERAGVVTLRTGVMDCDAHCLSRSRVDEKPAPGRFVYLEVADTGCGMDDVTQRRLFEPFFTTKFTGRGLGMAAVLGIVRGHKGAICVDSAPNRGTTILVLFPLASSPEIQPHEAPPPAGAPDASGGARRGTVLVVDDERVVVDVCARMLRRFGFDVLVASDGLEAIELFSRQRGAIACVILDLTMPRMDGVATLRELKRLDPDVQVLLASGYGEEVAMQRVVGEGLAGFIQKPFRVADLKEKLEQVLAARLAE